MNIKIAKTINASSKIEGAGRGGREGAGAEGKAGLSAGSRERKHQQRPNPMNHLHAS